ncbi:mucoidy inhibitor MuiA family protein [Massilia violaceinigra]|uniref:Mucoidy inhibitor MuiA family protein n=1 Tax=Massilia violaceinigra TaxID=2045208 RepID=A0ABY4ABA1_9BURK|nr:mucoidy inhibitor MuiA family protein [Massilia violaceinigra]UOD32088.1 mucoidy inhibitor MuiA family protein [Massilia violaceinigra]
MRPALLSILALSSPICLASTIAPVTAVTLYPGSATVVRTAQVAAGATEVVIDGLPANFNLESVRVQAAPGIRVADVVSRDKAGSEAVNPAEARLAGEIERLKDQKAVLDAESRSAAIVKGYLERYNGGAAEGGKAQGPDNGKALAGVIDTLGRGASEALIKIQKLAVQQRALDKKIAALESDLAGLDSNEKDVRSMVVRLAASRAGTLTISYQRDNAGWKPGYRASLDSAASRVDLERLATMSQSTGEDWSNVKLTLSTSQPRLSPSGREPQPWLLAYRPPQLPRPAPAPVAAAPMNMLKDGYQRVEVTGSSIKRVNEYDIAELQGVFATEFEVPGRVNLASDGRAISVTLATLALPVTQHLRVSPRLEKFAIVMAEAARPDGVWPSGNMQLFRDGGYIGATQWNLQDGDKALFSFGRDDLVKVSLDPVAGKTGSKGIFGGRASSVRADVFTLVNRHKTPVELLVFDSSPVSTSEEVKVEATFDPKPFTDTWEQRRGVVAWKKTLAAGATATFQVEYKIDYPKEGSVSGLR